MFGIVWNMLRTFYIPIKFLSDDKFTTQSTKNENIIFYERKETTRIIHN